MTQTQDQLQRWLPHFEPGQVVTAGALNQLAGTFEAAGRFNTRQFYGTGIVFGLSGELVGDTLSFGPGLALDEQGRLIVVAKDRHLDLTREISPEAFHPSVIEDDSYPPGFESAVPILSYFAGRSADRMGGGPRREASFRIDLVRGQVSTPVPDSYRLTPLAPLRHLRASKEFVTEFDQLKDGILEQMKPGDGEEFAGEGFAASARRRLGGLGLSKGMLVGRPTAVDLLSIAALNDMVYTLWQRDRAQRYLELRGFTAQHVWPDPIDGVEHGMPLGWLYRRGPGEAWNWDGRFRSGFALGLSRLELLGYAPRGIRQICVTRIASLLKAVRDLRPLQDQVGTGESPADSSPVAWTISPRGYESGTEAWMQALRLDRPQRIASLWPIDPLRGRRQGPQASVPSVRCPEVDPRRSPEISWTGSLSPSVLDPVNDPFTFSDYADAARVDPSGAGLVGLAELMGHSLGPVWTVLQRQRSHAGRGLVLDRRPVSILDDVACRDLEFVMVASFGERLTLVTDGAEAPRVIGFARRTSTTPARREPQAQRQSFLGWLFSR